MTEIISGVVIGGENRFPRENLSRCGQLTAFLFVLTCVSALWNRHVKLMDHRCLLDGLQVHLFSAGGYFK